MARNLGIAAGVVVAVVLALLALTGGDPDLQIDGSDTPTRPATAELSPGELAAQGSVTVDTLPEFDATTAEVDLNEGPAALSGKVLSAFGGAEAQAQVTLYRLKLPESIADDGGIPFWRFFRGNFDLQEELKGAAISLARVIADDEGNYAFRGLAAGSYVAAAQGHGALNTPGELLDYLDAPLKQDITLRPAALLEGRVISPEGDGIADAAVSARGIVMQMDRGFGGNLSADKAILYVLNPVNTEVTSAADGSFSFARLPHLEYEVTAVSPPWARATKAAQAPQTELLEIVMQPGATIVGRVVDDRGVGVAQAEVAMQVSWTERRRNFRGLGGGSGSQEVITDADGNFRFVGVAAGNFRIEAQRAGYQPKSIESIATKAGEETDALLLEMPPGFVIAGVVRGAGKDTVSKVRVRANSTERRRGRGRGFGFGRGPTVESDAEGAFRFDTLAEGEYELSFDHKEWSDKEETVQTGETALVVDLEPAVMISGRLVDADGVAVVQARVAVRGEGRDRNRARSDTEGRFSVARVNGTNTFSVTAKGFLDWEEELPENENALGDIEMAPAIMVSGIILGPEGDPIDGARVTATEDMGDDDAGGFFGGNGGAQQRGRGGRQGRQARGGRGGRNFFGGSSVSATSGADGTYQLALTSVGGLWDIKASNKGMLDAETRVDAVADVEGVDLQLTWGAIVTGVVLASDARPVDDARVSLRSGRGGRGFGGLGAANARTLADGSFQVSGLEEGDYRLSVTAKGFAPYEQSDFALAANEQRRNIEIRLEPEQILTGVVQDPLGNPLVGARVFATVQTDTDDNGGNGGRRRGRGRGRNVGMALSSPDGSFSIPQLKNVAYTVTASLDGYQQQTVNDVLPSAPLLVTLQPTLSLMGLVVDANNNEPLAQIRVTATPANEATNNGGGRRGRGGGAGRSRATSDVNGAFTLTNLVEGRYTISVRSDDYASYTGEVSIPQGNDQYVIALTPGVRAFGSIFDFASRPITGASVMAYPVIDAAAADENAATPTPAAGGRGGGNFTRRNRPAARANTDSDGNFQLRGLEEGRYRLEISHNEFIPFELEEIELVVGTDREIRQRLEKGAEIEGRVLDADGEPMNGVVQVQGQDFEFSRTARIEGGRYRIAGLPEGSYQVSYRTGRRDTGTPADVVEVKERQRLERDLHPES